MIILLPSGYRLIVRVHSVHLMNTAQRQAAADLWIKSTSLSHRPA